MGTITKLVKCAGKTRRQKLRICDRLMFREIEKAGVMYKVYEAVIALDKDEKYIRLYARKV